MIYLFFFLSKELNPARVRLAQLSVMCKADMIHCAPRLSDSMNDSLCQSQPDKDWVLREAPTWEPSTLSQSSLLAGRLIWDKVMVMCLLQRILTGQSVPSAFRTTAIRVASFNSFFLFWNFSTMSPHPPLDWLLPKLHYICRANKASLSKRNPPNRTKRPQRLRRMQGSKRDSWEGLWMMDRLVRYKEKLYHKFTGMQMLTRAKGFSKVFQSKTWPLWRCAVG